MLDDLYSIQKQQLIFYNVNFYCEFYRQEQQIASVLGRHFGLNKHINSFKAKISQTTGII